MSNWGDLKAVWPNWKLRVWQSSSAQRAGHHHQGTCHTLKAPTSLGIKHGRLYVSCSESRLNNQLKNVKYCARSADQHNKYQLQLGYLSLTLLFSTYSCQFTKSMTELSKQGQKLRFWSQSFASSSQVFAGQILLPGCFLHSSTNAANGICKCICLAHLQLEWPKCEKHPKTHNQRPKKRI